MHINQSDQKIDISLIFNVADLYEFYEGEKNHEEGTLDEWKQQLLVKLVEEVEKILVKRVGKKTRNQEYLEYLVTLLSSL